MKYNRTVVITPTRSRPENFARMVESCQAMSAGGVDIYAGIDEDDPKLKEYSNIKTTFGYLRFYTDTRQSLSGWTNYLAEMALESLGEDIYLVSMGDDHIVKTSFWEVKLMAMLRLLDGPGFAYGDDLMNGSGLCTCWMVHGRVVSALGWMMLPTCKHMYVDNAIMELGQESNRISYVPNVTIEHLHPVIKKSEMDETYLDAEPNYVTDLEQFRNWRYGPKFQKDVETLKNLEWQEPFRR